jgi:hypothetical protein
VKFEFWKWWEEEPVAETTYWDYLQWCNRNLVTPKTEEEWEIDESRREKLKNDSALLTSAEQKVYDRYMETPGGSNPKQYGLPEGSKDLQDLIEYRNMNFALGNIFKACYRFGTCDHSDELREINKILWFAEREKERLTRKNSDGD